MKTIISISLSILLVAAGIMTQAPDGALAAESGLHGDYDSLLERYVRDGRVDYDAWATSETDVSRLSDYVDRLETTRPDDLARGEALAFWLNLYNAATLELVLSHHPISSIKKIGGLFRSPWKIDVVTVDGRDLTLDEIENDVIRPRFGDPRIHFALNCASIGCPPLAGHAFSDGRLEEQLHAVTWNALNDARWVLVESDRLRVTKIFDWFRSDFEADGGSVIDFILRHREPADHDRIRSLADRIHHLDWNWDLNRVDR